MKTKKLAVLTALFISYLGLSGSLHAEFLSLSVGFPVMQSYNDLKIEYSDKLVSTNPEYVDTEVKADGIPTGALIHANIPFFPGLGVEVYQTKLKVDSGYDLEKDVGDTKLKTVMYDLFYLLPIPFVNITLGGGMGQVELDCRECDDYFKKGSATQYFLQIGIPVLALFDLHFSYHGINSDIDSKVDTVKDISFDSTMYAFGAAFVF